MITARPGCRAAVRISGVLQGRVGEALVHADTEMLGRQSRGQAGSTTIVRASVLLPFAGCGATENESDLPDKAGRCRRRAEESHAKVGEDGTLNGHGRREAHIAGLWQPVVLLCRLERASVSPLVSNCRMKRTGSHSRCSIVGTSTPKGRSERVLCQIGEGR